jgi:hypothetical protein
MPIAKSKYNSLLKQIRQLVEQARHNVARSINTDLLLTYWNVGRLIVEYEQAGNIRAEYGKQLLVDLSKSLTNDIGKGFSRSNLQMMRLFYIRFELTESSIRQTLSGKFKITKSQTASGKSNTVQILSEQGKIKTGLIVSHQLSWSHYCELLKQNKPAKKCISSIAYF